jgi:Protein of unknown function (DUF3034)
VKASYSALIWCVTASVFGIANADTGKLLLTGGVGSVDGSAGGGITPWAVIGTPATEGQIGYSATVSNLKTQDYGLTTTGIAVGLNDRIEISYNHQDFDASVATKLNALGFGVTPNQHIGMDILGAKVRVAGDAVLNSDSLMPQIAVGLNQKTVQAGSITPVLNFLGTKTSGTEAYASATKLLLADSILLNGTLRYSNANQNGLLGFGSAAPGKNDMSLLPEFSAAYLLRKDLAIGFEYRAMSNNLDALGQAAGLGHGLASDDWQDIFIAWAPSKHASFTFAYVDLGRIIPAITSGHDQAGFYVSAQFGF